MTTSEIKEKVRSVEGFLEDEGGEFLYKAAKRCGGEGVIVEIGSFKGKSAIWLGAGSLAGNKVPIYAIDPHISNIEHVDKGSSFPDFQKNIKEAGVSSIIFPIVKKSEEAAMGWTLPIEVLWIDGDHAYEFIKKDLRLWLPHLLNDGLVAIDDAVVGEDIKRAIREEIYQSPYYRNFKYVTGIFYATKTKEPRGFFGDLKITYLDLLEKVLIFSRKFPWPFRSTLRKIQQKTYSFLRGV